MLWIVLSIVIIILIILCSRIYITCNFNYTHTEQSILVIVTFYHIRILKKKVPISNDNSNISNIDFDDFPNKIRKAVHMLRELNTIATSFLNKMYFHKLTWHTKGGTGEASTTGIAAGGVWSIKGLIIGLIVNKSYMKCNPVINVIPLFQQRLIHSNFDCIVSIKIGQAIHALLKVIRIVSIKEKAIIIKHSI